MQYIVKSLTEANMARLAEMLKVLAPDYSTHMVITPEYLTNTQPKYNEKLNVHQIIYQLLRQKFAARGINSDIVNPVKNNKVIVKDVNGICEELYNRFLKVYPIEE